MSQKKYIVITGNGRSGTNWVLDILNMSPLTHCRNEPHRISSSPLHYTTQTWKAGSDIPKMIDRWDQAAAWTASTFGERDPRTVTPKKHIYTYAKTLNFINLPLRPKVRKFMGVFLPSLNQAEWPIPWWMGSQQSLKEAVAVFKVINIDARHIIWLLENRPHVPIIHVVRHPGGRLNSWLNRFLSAQDKTTILDRNRRRLETIRMFDKDWAQHFGDIDDMDVIETEVWLWRYFNEALYKVGQQHSQYLCLTYEDIVQDPLNYAAKLYDFCGLSWDQDISAYVESRLGESVWGKVSDSSKDVATAWRAKLSPQNIDMVNQILSSSIMQDWWAISK